MGTSAALEPAAKNIQAAYRHYSGRKSLAQLARGSKDSRSIQELSVGNSTSNDLKVAEKSPPIFAKKSEWSEVASQSMAPSSTCNVTTDEEVRVGHEQDAAEEAAAEDDKKDGVSIDHHPTTEFSVDGQQPNTPSEAQSPIASEPSHSFSEPTVAATPEQDGIGMTATDNFVLQEEATEQSPPEVPQEVLAPVVEDSSPHQPNEEEEEEDDAF